jgi:uncharacterized protein
VTVKDSLRSAVASAALRLDGWTNVLSGMGTSRDRSTATRFDSGVRISRQLADNLVHEDPLFRTIAMRPPQEMTRKGIEIAIDDDPGGGKAVSQVLEEIAARKTICAGITWAGVHGGGILVVGADDGQEDMATPLNEQGIRAVRWVNSLHRWQVRPLGKNEDPLSKGYGLPEAYEVLPGAGNAVAAGTVVHASRTIRLCGLATSADRRALLEGWDESVLLPVYETVRDFVAAHKGIAYQLSDGAVGKFRVKNLAQMLTQGETGAELIRTRLALLDMCKSAFRAIPLDSEGEDFTREAMPLSGVPEAFDRLASLISMATGMPQTVLFGRSPAGLSATGESDLSLWYDMIGARQEDELRDVWERIIRLVLLSKEGPTRGQEPAAWSFRFRPLWQESGKEQAEKRLITAQADAIYAALPGGLTGTEIVESRYGGGEWSPETVLMLTADERKERAKDAPPPSGERVAEPADMPSIPVDDVQGTALNGAQIASLAAILEKVATAVFTRATARPLILAAFPAISEVLVDGMLAGVVVNEPQPGGPTPGKTDAAPITERGDEGDTDHDAILEALRAERLEIKLKPVLEETVNSATRAVMVELGFPASHSFDLLNPLVKSYLAEYAGTRGKLADISQTTRDILRTALRESSLKGEGQAARVARIRDLFTEGSEARIQAIAHTEAHSAQAWATHQAHKASGVVDKVKWVHRGPTAGGEREGHALMDGQIVKLGEVFTNPLTGAKAVAPGQFGRADEDINCRCGTVAFIDLTPDPDAAPGAEVPQPRDDARQPSDDEQISAFESRVEASTKKMTKALTAAFRMQMADVIKAAR